MEGSGHRVQGSGCGVEGTFAEATDEPESAARHEWSSVPPGSVQHRHPRVLVLGVWFQVEVEYRVSFSVYCVLCPLAPCGKVCVIERECV